LRNICELAGRWNSASTISGATAPFNINGGIAYAGFSGLDANVSATAQNPANLSYILSQDTTTAGYTARVAQRYREASLRALANAGQTRVWNLMIDVVAQTGRYPQSASGFTSNNKETFVVEGEQRYWVHVAIDRLTGQVIDKQIEVVKE
jgi:hypothetical protein